MNHRDDARPTTSDQDLEGTEESRPQGEEVQEDPSAGPQEGEDAVEEPSGDSPEGETAEAGSPAPDDEGASDPQEGQEGSDRRSGRDSTSVDELELSLEASESDAAGGEESSVTREDQLAAQVERLQAEVDVHRDKWLRAMAEFENFRKRTRRELDSSLNLARASVFKQLLEVVDNFERALGAAETDSEADSKEFMAGMALIRDQLVKLLKEHDVHRIEAEGKEFDPRLHEAISQIESEEVPSEHVAQVVQEGYQLGDMVLRPAVVIVAE